ncbi:MAG: hypothetical protein IJX59_01910, partial [Clostridia bacterium]|nr:hypothetical protein [Clostridia bacterium]
KKENRSHFLKGNRRIRPHPVRCTAAEMPFTYVVAFFPKTARVFKKNFSIFQNFFGAPRRVRRAPRSSAALVQVPSLYKYVFSWKINAFPEIFSIFLFFWSGTEQSPIAKLKKESPKSKAQIKTNKKRRVPRPFTLPFVL